MPARNTSPRQATGQGMRAAGLGPLLLGPAASGVAAATAPGPVLALE